MSETPKKEDDDQGEGIDFVFRCLRYFLVTSVLFWGNPDLMDAIITWLTK